MKKTFVTWLSGLSICAILLTGCNAGDQVKSAVEHSYEVVVKGQDVLEVVASKLIGSEVWDEVEIYVTSLNNALVSMESALNKIAPWVGAELYVSSTPDQEQTTSVLSQEVSTVIRLNNAVESLNEVIK